jgi:hypothetical protein
MQKLPISQDDLVDVKEMSEKIQDAVSEILEGNDMCLCMSALISATINSMVEQCNSVGELKYYGSLFFAILDTCINSIEKK